MKLHNFITRARTLIDDSSYPAANRKEMLPDKLVFGIKSEKVRNRKKASYKSCTSVENTQKAAI